MQRGRFDGAVEDGAIVVGLALLTAGLFLAFGMGVSLIVLGVLLLAGGVFAVLRGG